MNTILFVINVLLELPWNNSSHGQQFIYKNHSHTSVRPQMCGLLTLKLQGQQINYFNSEIKRNFNCRHLPLATTKCLVLFLVWEILIFMVCSHKCIGYSWKISLKQLQVSLVHRGAGPLHDTPDWLIITHGGILSKYLSILQ